jgi:hypothetical protein
MSVNEELSEGTEHAKEPFDKKVAVTMAIIAAALAIVSVFGQLFANEELLKQAKASDQWSYYQAKSIRRYQSEVARDMFQGMTHEAAPKSAAAYAANAERYRKESEEVQTEARGLEAESEVKGRQALRMHLGEIFLEMGIVFASLAILSKREIVWYASIVSALIGGGIALTMLTIH